MSFLDLRHIYRPAGHVLFVNDSTCGYISVQTSRELERDSYNGYPLVCGINLLKLFTHEGPTSANTR